MATSAKIKAIDKQVVHRICSGQVILDLATAVKELVENALDAGASNVEVRLKECGAESLEVADNGTGIAPSDYHALTLKYHTSKLQTFSDLQELNSFGFRGEALSSLCALGEVHVVTRQADQSAGVKLEFGNTGKLKGTNAAARSVGTTVCIKNIFKPLPVRFKEFKRNLKKEYAKMVMLLQAYALISTEVRMICTNQTGNGPRSTVVSTQASDSVRDNIVTVFGSRTADGLEALEASATEGLNFSGFVSRGTAGMSRATGDRQFLFLNGRPIDLPKAVKMINETFRSLASPALAHHKPMFVINIIAPPHSYDVNVTPDKRKVFMQDEAGLLNALQEALNAIWEPTRSRYEVHGTQAEPKSKKMRLSKEAEPNSDEDNETKEATEPQNVKVEDTEEIETPLNFRKRSGQSSMFATLQRSSGQSQRNSLLGDMRRSSAGTPVLSNFGKDSRTPKQPLISRFSAFGSGAKSGSNLGKPNTSESKRIASEDQESKGNPEDEESDATESNEDGGQNGKEGLDSDEETKSTGQDTPAPTNKEEILEPEDPMTDNSAQDQEMNESLEDRTFLKDSQGLLRESPKRKRESPDVEEVMGDEIQENTEEPIQDPSILNEVPEEFLVENVHAREKTLPSKLTAQVSLKDLQNVWKKRRKTGDSDAASKDRQSPQFQAASLQGQDLAEELQPASSENLSLAASELERVFQKSQFKELEILGQFNLGFIIARLGQDLFIIDQHASDEKYNFERLTKTTQLNRQPLLQPQLLDLTPSEAIVIRDSLNVFAHNGFEIQDTEGKLYLKGVPYSQNISFGASDVQELAQLLHEGTSNLNQSSRISTQGSVSVSDKIPRPSRVRSMLAMRACRSSIMIGKTLDMRTMRRILDHLAELDSPWNCPHGRPTMRHLAVLPQ